MSPQWPNAAATRVAHKFGHPWISVLVHISNRGDNSTTTNPSTPDRTVEEPKEINPTPRQRARSATARRSRHHQWRPPTPPATEPEPAQNRAQRPATGVARHARCNCAPADPPFPPQTACRAAATLYPVRIRRQATTRTSPGAREGEPKRSAAASGYRSFPRQPGVDVIECGKSEWQYGLQFRSGLSSPAAHASRSKSRIPRPSSDQARPSGIPALAGILGLLIGRSTLLCLDGFWASRSGWLSRHSTSL